MQYEVIVGNIGSVHIGTNPVEARRIYGIYKAQSESGMGRAGNESVTILRNNEIDCEYVPNDDTRPED